MIRYLLGWLVALLKALGRAEVVAEIRQKQEALQAETTSELLRVAEAQALAQLAGDAERRRTDDDMGAVFEKGPKS